MSCDAAASAALMWFAATAPMAPPPALQLTVAQAPSSVAHEPLFADIVQRAKRLKAEVDAFRGNDRPIPEAFGKKVSELSDLDMKGHLTLAQRGTDGDLKCILRGISQDLPLKLAAVTDAKDRKARDLALRDMSYLLNDNVEVITAPPAPAV
jgi:hypothetical protein